MIVRNAARLLFWHNGLLASYYSVAPLTTVSLVLAFALSRVLHVAAFFVPLKILLLVTSDGVPSYFRAFIVPEDKNVWVVGLVLAVVAAYGVSLALASATKSIARAGATEIERLRSGHPHGMPSADLVSGYSRVTESYGDLLFFAVAFSVGLYFNPVLFVAFVIVLAAEAAVCGLFLRRYLSTQADGAELIYEKWPRAAGVFSSVNFLVGFAILLAQFLYIRPVNVLIGILSIFLLRQMLAALTRYSLHGSWLWQHKDDLNVQVVRVAPRRHRLPRHLIALKAHLSPRHYQDHLAQRLMGAGLPEVAEATSLLLENRAPDFVVVRSTVRFHNEEGERAFVDRIYLLQGIEALRQEDLCLYHVPALADPALRIISTESSEILASRLCEIDLDRPASPTEVKTAIESIYRRLWTVRPSAELKGIWNARHASLESRLAKAPLQLLSAATTSQSQREDVDNLIASIPFVRSQIRKAPLYVSNTRIGRATTFFDSNGRPLMLDWTQWRVEPVGIGLLSVTAPDDFAREMAETIRRHDRTAIVSDNLLFLVAHSADLLTKLERLQLTAALSAAEAVLQRVRMLQDYPPRAAAAS